MAMNQIMVYTCIPWEIYIEIESPNPVHRNWPWIFQAGRTIQKWQPREVSLRPVRHGPR
jgi:hypothetical protein